MLTRTNKRRNGIKFYFENDLSPKSSSAFPGKKSLKLKGKTTRLKKKTEEGEKQSLEKNPSI